MQGIERTEKKRATAQQQEYKKTRRVTKTDKGGDE